MNYTAPLSLGVFEHSGEEYLYNSNESLITIARPGRGKTQAHVIRNLLYLGGPAIVLDVKPEIYEAVNGWREQFGMNIVFRPGGDATETRIYNPLDSIPDEPVAADSAIRRLLPLLMVPADAKGAKSFWEGRAAQLLHGALYDVCLNADPGERNMAAVVDWFSPSPAQLAERIVSLQQSGIRSLVRIGNQLEMADEETRANLFDTVLRHIEIWGSPQIESVTRDTTIPIDLIRPYNLTLYICVTPEELVAYRPVIRCLLGEILYTLRDLREEWDGLPVTFFLDEFPQLGYMPEIEQMLALGRQAGLRLWLFCQTKGQLAQAYGDANRLLEMMAVQCYIEPTGDLAEDIARWLPTIKDGWSGKEKPLATAVDLSGPEYKDKVIVLEGGRQPARLYAMKAFEDPVARKRLHYRGKDSDDKAEE